MQNSIIASVRSLIETADRDRNLETNSALDKLQSRLASLMKVESKEFDFETAFCELFDDCRDSLQIDNGPNTSLLDCFTSGGYITGIIKSDKLFKELSRHDPISKKMSRLQPVTDAGMIDEFNTILGNMLKTFLKKNFTQFIEGDPKQKRSSEIESGVYLVDGEAELIIRSSDDKQKATFPDFILKLTREGIQVYFYHPVEDIWKLYDGTVYFNGLAQEIREKFNQLVSRACRVKKSFNFAEELIELQEKCIKIAKQRKKIKPVLVDQLGRIIYTFSQITLSDGVVAEFVSFYFYAKNIKTEVRISFRDGVTEEANIKTTHLIAAVSGSQSLFSIDEGAIPTAEQHQLVEVGRVLTSAFLDLSIFKEGS